MKYSGHRKLLCELSKLSNLMLLTSSDTKRTLRHLFLFTNSAQRELVSICTQIYTTAIDFPCLTFLMPASFFSGECLSRICQSTIQNIETFHSIQFVNLLSSLAFTVNSPDLREKVKFTQNYWCHFVIS